MEKLRMELKCHRYDVMGDFILTVYTCTTTKTTFDIKQTFYNI